MALLARPRGIPALYRVGSRGPQPRQSAGDTERVSRRSGSSLASRAPGGERPRELTPAAPLPERFEHAPNVPGRRSDGRRPASSQHEPRRRHEQRVLGRVPRQKRPPGPPAASSPADPPPPRRPPLLVAVAK